MKAARVCRGVIAFALLAGAGMAGLLMLVGACTTTNSASAKGEECFAAGDCAPGLVCVPQRSGARICSDDLSQVTGQPPAEAGARDAGDAAKDGPADAPDQGVDTGLDTGVDTGVKDAGDAG